jgi:hypothetical protein
MDCEQKSLSVERLQCEYEVRHIRDFSEEENAVLSVELLAPMLN